MKLTYIFNNEIISEKASVVQAIHMGNAFALNGTDVEMVLPSSKEKNNITNEYILNRFGINNKMNFSYYSKIKIFNHLEILGSYFGIKKYLAQNDSNIYFTRCPFIFSLLADRNLPVIYEAHNAKIHNKINIFNQYWTNKVINASQKSNCLAFITISKNLANYWAGKGVPLSKILPLHDGFDSTMFVEPIEKSQARSELNLPLENNIVTYTGSLYPDREIDNILNLAAHFPDDLFVVVGGPQVNADYYRSFAKDKKIANIKFTGPVEHTKVPLCLYASDVLLALWSQKVPTINYCSPLKLFEYMASGRTLVAHGFPTVKEVIKHNKNGLLVSPDDFNDLVNKLRIALNKSDIKKIGKLAREEAFEKYTWDKRALQILAKVKMLPEGNFRI